MNDMENKLIKLDAADELSALINAIPDEVELGPVYPESTRLVQNKYYYLLEAIRTCLQHDMSRSDCNRISEKYRANCAEYRQILARLGK